MASSQQFCTFYLQSQVFGVPVQRVQEVLNYQEMTRVPLMPETIRGLINLRGQIVTAIDLRRCLGLPDRDAGRQPMNVVVRSDEGGTAVPALIAAVLSCPLERKPGRVLLTM